MRDRVRVLAVGFLLVVVGLHGGSAAGAAEELPPWGVVPSPNQGSHDNALKAVGGLEASDLWAVGEFNPGVPPTVTGRRTLIEHWDGTQWAIVRSPNPSWSGMDYATLEDVVVLSPTDAWAVGYSQDFATLRLNTLIMHWDGTQWRIVRSPNPAGTHLPNQLLSIAAESADNIWAVGGMGTDNRALILHWDGERWTVVENGCQVGLRAVVTVTPNQVWAAGNSTLCRYDGKDWTVVPSPQPRPEHLEISYPLWGLAATGPNDVWAVGARVQDFYQYLVWSTLIEHWDGSSWTAYYQAAGQNMFDVAALASDDVWAVGTDGAAPLILHYDGATWSAVPTPAPNQGGALAGALALSASDLWAVGHSFNASGDSLNLVVHAPSTTGGNVAGNTAVAGAIVSWFGPESGSTAADASGAYVAVDLSAGNYTFTAQASGCTPASAQVSVVAGTTVTQDLIVQCP